MTEEKIRVSANLAAMYAGYYEQGDQLAIKRALAARDSVDHITALRPRPLGRLLDVGAGNGNVLQEIAKRGLATEVSALEISAAGIEKIEAQKLAILKEVRAFDGYRIPYEDNSFDSAISIHVLEHVEHERAFLREIGRVARDIFIEVPLEGGARGRLNYKFGHINYYTPLSFRAILETSGLTVVKSKVVTSSRALEQFLYGRWPGTVRNVLRNVLLRTVKDRAPDLMTFLMIAHCQPQRRLV